MKKETKMYKRKLNSRIAAAYLGARILDHNTDNIGELSMVANNFLVYCTEPNGNDQTGDVSQSEYESNYDDCQLILRPLDLLTDEHYLIIGKLICESSIDSVMIKRSKKYIEDYKKFGTTGFLYDIVATKLRELGFDAGFEDIFSLIDEDIAITGI